VKLEGEKMKKIVIALGILLVIAMVLPVAAAPAIAKTTGGGFVICPDGQKCTVAWTAQADPTNYPYGAKGQAEIQARSGAGTIHAQVDQLGIAADVAYVSGIVTSAPDDPSWLGVRICFVVYDGGKGGDDYISDWWRGDIELCYEDIEDDDFYLIESGNAIVTYAF
jgi:hypothetical protein